VKAALVAATMLCASIAQAGPYTAPAIQGNDPRIVGWATGFENLVRGPIDIANPAGALATFGAGESALGSNLDATDVVSLGDGGSITLTFASPVVNGPGADFAVFENGFSVLNPDDIFAELAFVEVSSNGSTFTRFPSVSLTPVATQIATFGTIDRTNILNLAGKDEGGTGFDLSDVGLASITHVRLVDVVGRISSTTGYSPRLDSLGNVISDPYPTNFASGGFDLNGVAALNIPEPALLSLALLAPVILRRR
jgi:hypothetical protein